MGVKYSNLPGVRKLHDFLVVRAHDGRVVMKVRENIYTGTWSDSPLTLSDASLPGVPTDTYNHHTRNLSKEKMSNMVQMYDKFIPPRYRPDYIPSDSNDQ